MNIVPFRLTQYRPQTSSTIEMMLVALAMHPKVQKEAQSALDGVVGPDRLPEFYDLEQLPYITAIVREVARWMPIAPLSLPHATTEDDVYNGYHIPKGSIVVAVSLQYTNIRVIRSLLTGSYSRTLGQYNITACLCICPDSVTVHRH